MADLLSPVKEECVRHGHELNVSECQGSESCSLGWLDVGVSLAWWSTGPFRFGVLRVVKLHPPTGNYLLSKVDPMVEVLQSNFPAMTDEKSEKAVTQLRNEVMRKTRHRIRSVIRSGAGRGVLQGLDKMISLSESILDYIEPRHDDDGTTPPGGNYDEAQDDDCIERPGSRDGSDSAVNMDESPGEIVSWKCDRSTMTNTNSSANTTTLKVDRVWMLMARPVHIWLYGFKSFRRYLYRVGRLRRCKSTRTPAKDIAKRPMLSPRKRHQVGGSFTTMIKYALSPIAGKLKKTNLEDVRGVKAKEFRVPLKRKYSKVTPYSVGDDSDNDTGRIVDDYFQLQDYDSEEDSDYEWHSSDDYLTSDSEEYKSDSDGNDTLKDEIRDVEKDAGQELVEVRPTERKAKTRKQPSEPQPIVPAPPPPPPPVPDIRITDSAPDTATEATESSVVEEPATDTTRV